MLPSHSTNEHIIFYLSARLVVCEILVKCDQIDRFCDKFAVLPLESHVFFPRDLTD